VNRRFACVAALIVAGAAPLRADFVRGDTNHDGQVNVTDAVSLLRHLFRSGEGPPCEDAADANDDGKVAIDDAVASLNFLFADGTLPNPGGAAGGPDPTCDQLGCASSPDPTPALVLSEIQYNPAGDIQAVEYVELYNRTPADLSLAGWHFTNGIDFSFPVDAMLPPGGFVLVLKAPENSKWRRVTGLKLGPYEGSLSDGGERLTMANGDCEGESIRYSDRPPWPVAPDGGGPPLERIDYLGPAEDFHSWRASVERGGTPNALNASYGEPSRPVITLHSFAPPHPTSRDPVAVLVGLDAPPAAISKVSLHWEAVAGSLALPAVEAMALDQSFPEASVWRATLPPQPSQTLVRMLVELELADGRRALLPHRAEPRPAIGYFVYDQEMPSLLPTLWIFQKRRTGLPLDARLLSGVVILEPPSAEDPKPVPLVLDGADIRISTQGQKIRFVKGEEYLGYRTLNRVPEEGGGGTGAMAPHMEHIGFKTFRDLGALAPRADWFRVVDYGSAAKRHTQRLLIQQVNERFFEMNGLSPDGDLYKLDKSSWAKRTNLDSGGGSLSVLMNGLGRGDPLKRREAVLEMLDVENVGLYSIVTILIENWDGFHNNLYIYNELTPGARWKVIPWDLDQVYEPIRWDFPVNFPLTGVSATVSRETGPISRPYHLEKDLHEAYLEGMRQRIAPGGIFTVERIKAQIDEVEKLLLDDLALQETYLGAQRAARRAQIKSAYTALRTFTDRRVPYLEGVLAPQ